MNKEELLKLEYSELCILANMSERVAKKLSYKPDHLATIITERQEETSEYVGN